MLPTFPAFYIPKLLFPLIPHTLNISICASWILEHSGCYNRQSKRTQTSKSLISGSCMVMYRLPLYFDAMEIWILIQPHSCTVRLQSRDFGLSRIQNNANLQIMVGTTEQTNVPTSVLQKAYRNTVACYIWPVNQPTKYPKHIGLSGLRLVQTALSKNCVAHFFAIRFPTIILVQKVSGSISDCVAGFVKQVVPLSLQNSVSSCQRWLADCCRIGAIASLFRLAKCFRENP